MAAPSQEKWHNPFRASRRPIKSPKRMEKKWMAVVRNKRTQGAMDRVPVHKPADTLSMDSAIPRKAASIPERTEGEELLIFWEIRSVVSLESGL